GSNGVAIGHSANVLHANSVAIGQSATTTAANQIRLGTATEQVSIPGTINVATNQAPFRYTTGWLGALATPKTNGNQRAMLLVSLSWADSATGRPEATVAITGCCTNVYSSP